MASARKKLKACNIANSLKGQGLKSKLHILLERLINAVVNVSTNRNPYFDNDRRQRLLKEIPVKAEVHTMSVYPHQTGDIAESYHS